MLYFIYVCHIFTIIYVFILLNIAYYALLLVYYMCYVIIIECVLENHCLKARDQIGLTDIVWRCIHMLKLDWSTSHKWTLLFKFQINAGWVEYFNNVAIKIGFNRLSSVLPNEEWISQDRESDSARRPGVDPVDETVADEKGYLPT